MTELESRYRFFTRLQDRRGKMKFKTPLSMTAKTTSIIAMAFCGLMLSAYAHAQVPDCMNRGQVLPVNNDQVLQWKESTANQYHNRGHIQGRLVQAYPDHSGHHHLEVQIGAASSETIEVIYNEDFGPIPTTQPGDQIEACGDYITSNAQSGPYPASPDGAIIHWVHRSPTRNHDDGYVVVNGTLCGDHPETAGPKHGSGGYN